MKKIYIHIPDKEKRTTLEKICAEQDISIQELSLKDVNRTVATVCGMPMKTNEPHKTAPATCLPQPGFLVLFPFPAG